MIINIPIVNIENIKYWIRFVSRAKIFGRVDFSKLSGLTRNCWLLFQTTSSAFASFGNELFNHFSGSKSTHYDKQVCGWISSKVSLPTSVSFGLLLERWLICLILTEWWTGSTCICLLIEVDLNVMISEVFWYSLNFIHSNSCIRFFTCIDVMDDISFHVIVIHVCVTNEASTMPYAVFLVLSVIYFVDDNEFVLFRCYIFWSASSSIKCSLRDIIRDQKYFCVSSICFYNKITRLELNFKLTLG